MPNYTLNNIYEWPITIRAGMLALIFVLVLFLGYFFDISKLTLQISTAGEQEKDLKQQLGFVISEKAGLEKEISQLSKLEDMLKQWQGTLITQKELPELLNQILKFGAMSQLQFNFFNPAPEKKVGLYLDVPIKIVVTGNYHQIAGFISQIANMDKTVIISQFSIEAKENDIPGLTPTTPGTNLTASMLLEVYRLA